MLIAAAINKPALKDIIGLTFFQPLTTKTPIMVAKTPETPKASGNMYTAVPHTLRKVLPIIIAVI